MNGDDVRAAARAMTDALSPHTSRDWDTPAHNLQWTCRRTLTHIAHDLFAYAAQLASGATDAYLPFDAVVRDDTDPTQTLTVASAAAQLLARVVDTSPPAARAWHFGPTDPSGFAAMGVAELLLHTWDIVLPFENSPAPSPEALPRPSPHDGRPPAPLSAAVLSRLFPEAPPGDPVDVLLWCTGRLDLPDRPHQTDWVWKAALPS